MTSAPDHTDAAGDSGDSGGPGATEVPDRCSARGCQSPALHELRWNNPKLHTPERRKVWLACEEHRQSLADFLSARNFLREITPH